MNCELIKEQLSAYIDRELSPGEKAEVEMHLAECRACARELSELRTTIKTVAELPVLHAPKDASCSLKARMQAGGTQAKPPLYANFIRPAAVFASVAAALLIVFYIMFYKAPQADREKYGEYEPSVSARQQTDSGFIYKPESSPSPGDMSNDLSAEQSEMEWRNEKITVTGEMPGSDIAELEEMDSITIARADMMEKQQLEKHTDTNGEIVYEIHTTENELPGILLAFQSEVDRMNVYQDYDKPETAKELSGMGFGGGKGGLLTERNRDFNDEKTRASADSHVLAVTLELSGDQEQKLQHFISRASEKDYPYSDFTYSDKMNNVSPDKKEELKRLELAGTAKAPALPQSGSPKEQPAPPAPDAEGALEDGRALQDAESEPPQTSTAPSPASPPTAVNVPLKNEMVLTESEKEKKAAEETGAKPAEEFSLKTDEAKDKTGALRVQKAEDKKSEQETTIRTKENKNTAASRKIKVIFIIDKK